MRPKLRLDELNKALLIAAGVCYLLSFVLGRYAGVSTLFRLLFAAALIFVAVRLFAGRPDRRNMENMKYLAAVMAVTKSVCRMHKSSVPVTARNSQIAR